MPASVTELLENALALPAAERARLAEELLASLGRSDARIDTLWAKEAEDRLAAFEAGEMKATPAEEVSRLGRLRRARGIWKESDDLPELSELREEMNRS